MPRGIPHITAPERDRLTDREVGVLTLLAEGKESGQVAIVLGLSVHTVRDHMKRIRLKLDARSSAHCVAIAFRAGVLR